MGGREGEGGACTQKNLVVYEMVHFINYQQPVDRTLFKVVKKTGTINIMVLVSIIKIIFKMAE